MIMKLFNRDEAYKLTDDLLSAIKNRGQGTLEAFGITPAIYDEIFEELERSGEIVANLTPPRIALLLNQM